MARKKKKSFAGRKSISEEDKARGIALARSVKAAREAKNYRQEDLAYETGIRIDTLRAIESEKRAFSPSVFIIADLAEFLEGDLYEWLQID